MIYFNIPWSTHKNIGKSYNDFMEMVPSDHDFACFLDGDAMFLNTFFGKQLEAIIQRYPECGIFTCMTNRVGCAWQVLGDLAGDDIRGHRKVAERYESLECEPAPSSPLLSGVLILIKKSVWKKIGGFKDGLLGVDNKLHQSAIDNHEPVYVMKGVYVYHWYRGGKKDKSHLLLTPKKIIYSAITGNYDMPLVRNIPEGWDYKLFSNSRDIPNAIFVENHGLSDVKLAREIKINPWKYFDFDISVWVDANSTFNTKILKYIDKDFSMPIHPDRRCVYDEAAAVIRLKKDTPGVVQQVVNRYLAEGMPQNQGLYSTHGIIRKNTKEVREFCEKWWREVEQNSCRDQLSLPYLLWKSPIPITSIPFGEVFSVQQRHVKKEKKCDIYIAITTHNRPEEFQLLIEDIMREASGKNVHIHVYDDASSTQYTDPAKYHVTTYRNNHGKKGYWSVINDAMRDAEKWKFKYFFLFQDDCRLSRNFFDLAMQEYEAIEDKDKATLCTFTPQTVYERYMWSTKRAEDITYGDTLFLKCNYVDCIFMCPQETLRLLEYTVEPIPLTRFKNEVISSGVGQQLTSRLSGLSKNMYATWSSLISSHSNESKMNKKERKKNPLSPLIREQKHPHTLTALLTASNEKVTVGIASIKRREKFLEKTVQSLIDQVDEMHLYLNDYDQVPDFVKNNNKIVFHMGKIYKDRGDTGKFYDIDKVKEGYYFSCDDDIIYPKDYIQKTVDFLSSVDNRVIATYHGVILKEGKLHNYYRDRKQISFNLFQRNPVPVHIGGTGVMAFYIKTFRPDIKDFEYPNMADIWVGIQAQSKKVPIICAPRSTHWIKSQAVPVEETIYGSKKNHDIQTEVLNIWKAQHGEFAV